MVRLLLVIGLLAAVLPARASADDFGNAPLDIAFRDMYNLQFDAAHNVLGEWQRAHGEDPVGPVADAAAYLFSEFHRLHILEVEFFTNDKSFDSAKRLAPDPELKQRFFAALDRGTQLSQVALAHDPKDSNALFASVLALGLRGDYASLIEKRNLQGLSLMKQGRAQAERLLSVDPSRYDAYIAIGVENYLLSLKPAPLRWALHVTGAETDKSVGIDRLRLTAEKGHYLRPFARLLLAVAALRDHDSNTARQLLAGLAQQFPSNPLYAKELAAIH